MLVQIEAKKHGGTGDYWYEVWADYAEPGQSRFIETNGSYCTQTEAIKAGAKWAKSRGYVLAS